MVDSLRLLTVLRKPQIATVGDESYTESLRKVSESKTGIIMLKLLKINNVSINSKAIRVRILILMCK